MYSNVKICYFQDLLDKALQGILRQQDMHRDNPRELDKLIYQQRTIEKELSKVMHELAEASKSDENFRTKMMMEKDLAKVQNIMAGLNQQGARLSEAMNTLRRSSAGASIGAALSHDKTDAIEGDVQDGPWDIGDADDNTKRFFGGSSKYSDGNNPIYENLPPERKSSSWQSIQPLKNKTTSSQPRRSSLVHLVTPRPFIPFNSQNTAPSSLSNSSSMNLGYNSLLSPVSDDGVVKATRVIIQPAFASDNVDSDNINERPDYTPKGWSPVKTGLFNVKRTPQGRYMTISSSEPVKLETSLIQPATLHTSAGDLIPGNTLAVPEKVYIPERYIPDSDDEDISEEERQRRQERSEKIKRILTQQSVHSISQPDVSKVADQVHQQVQQEKIKRAQLLEVSQELARQVTIKSRQAAESYEFYMLREEKHGQDLPSKTSEDINNHIIPDREIPYSSYEHHDGPMISENMYI
ncbi:hypothetical protein KUTeg_023605 [Tegillarca granosa]|uniref:Pleckstrin homology domain-containing protein n=1 Tax=Tegillarca granosa TaxID=220873 RepID=A0ABQ9E7S0_TEGGR|nr:hypothetical protein KUTeg_023605 [Tegillarca granosa]